LINNFSKVARYKINSNKAVVLLYTKDKQVEKENRKTTPFTIVIDNVKHIVATIQARERYV
jgi:predicted ATP-dependent serine protease